MDQDIVFQKLESLRRCLIRIQQKRPSAPEELAANADLQDIISLNLTRAVQLCVDIGAHMIAEMNCPPPDTMGNTFDLLARAGVLPVELSERLKKAVGFRNIAVHNYEDINWSIVHAIATDHLGDFEEFAKVVANQMK